MAAKDLIWPTIQFCFRFDSYLGLKGDDIIKHVTWANCFYLCSLREHARSRSGRTSFLSSAKFDSPNPEFRWVLALFALVFTVKLLALFQRP